MKQFQQVAVSGFIHNEEGDVLVVKRAADDDFLPGYWEVPGGGTDFGEHPIIALKREIREETGLTIEVDRPIHIDDYFMEKNDEKIHRVEIFFVCHLTDVNQKVTLSHEHSQYAWVEQGNLHEFDMTEYQKKAIEAYFNRV